MLNKDALGPFLLVATAIFLGASSQSYAASHRTDTYQAAPSAYCPGCTGTAFVATLSGGPIWTDPGKTHTFFLQPDIQKTYTASRNATAHGTGELFLGVQTLLEEGFRGQLGLAAAMAGTSVQGHIWEDAEPIFDDFTYQYNLLNTRYAAKAKLLADITYGFAGYLSGSAGVAVNKARSFKITPIIPEAVPAPSFTSNSEIAVSYTLGIGFEHPLGEHFQAGIGYEYANWGKNGLSRAPGQSVSAGLGASHLYTNELLFSITFIA